MKKGTDYTGVTVVFACHDGAGRYLFAKRGTNCRDEHGTWDPGGGGLEFGDTVEGTLRKEIKEEYGADVLDFEFLGFRDVHREHNGAKTHWIALDYKVRIDPSQVVNGEPHKFDEIAWFTLDALPTPMHSQYPKFLELYGDRL
ncbi:MAG TPA: NUDIX domain-containing protein [Candidatus Paceibacterota bacterium]|nr:NUDIX domain-containing protein [Candidatus Paceibacterota bacterium]